MVVFEQDKYTPRRSLKHRMNRRVSSGSSDGRMEATCWRWIFVNLEYFFYIGFDYDLQLTRH
jgi:hypothetical protein